MRIKMYIIAMQLWQSLTTSVLRVLKSFIQRRLKVKSKEYCFALFFWKHSNPHNKIGVHLVLTSSKMTSSILPANDRFRPIMLYQLLLIASLYIERSRQSDGNVEFQFNLTARAAGCVHARTGNQLFQDTINCAQCFICGNGPRHYTVYARFQSPSRQIAINLMKYVPRG